MNPRIALICAVALAGCAGDPRECWRGDPLECEFGGNAGDGVSAAPDAPEAPVEPGSTPQPAAKPSRSTPAPREASTTPVSRPERPEKPDKPTPAPAPEKPSYDDWSQPGDDELFEGYSEAEVREKQMALAGQRAAAEAEAKAQAGGFNR